MTKNDGFPALSAVGCRPASLGRNGHTGAVGSERLVFACELPVTFP